MPHSGDEADQTQNPNRERLSTVQLRLTPTFEAHNQLTIRSMPNGEIVQFLAKIVIGDAEEALLMSSAVVTSSEPTESVESCISRL